MSISNQEPTKEQKKSPAKGSVEVVQKTDWGKKIKEYTLKGVTFFKEYALQVIMVITSILLFNLVIGYFGLTVIQGLMVFGAIALVAFAVSKIMDGSASQALEKVQTKLAAPTKAAA